MQTYFLNDKLFLNKKRIMYNVFYKGKSAIEIYKDDEREERENDNRAKE